MYKFLVFLFLLSSFSTAQVQKVEPAFWWSGMKNPNLQIMLYGNDIAGSKLDGSLLQHLTKVHKVENPNYLFLDVDLTSVQPGTYNISITTINGESEVINYEIKEREPNSANRKGFDSSDVIYLIMPDRFANGNPNNDSHPDVREKANRAEPGGRHGGDIQGIIDHLDYIQELGATAIWSTPLCEDNQPAYSYHTYAQTDLYKIDPRYGTNEDYKRLADEMHKRELKLIMDYVTNHWGSEHWMFKDLPSKDWFNYWEGKPNGYKNSTFKATTQMDNGATEYDKASVMEGWFASEMPDINQRNPLALNYIIQNAIWWIEYAGLDGLRVDTYVYNDQDGIAKWTKAIMDEYPNFNIVGEAWMYDPAQISYWQKDSPIAAIKGYNSYLPSVMDFQLQEAVVTMFNETPEWPWIREGLMRAYENFVNDFLFADINNIMVFAGNHDISRINEYYNGDLNKYKLAMSLIFTIRGIPQIYYGDEIGMLGNKEKRGDGDIRHDFPGGWSSDTQNAFTQAGRTKSQESYHNFTKKVLNWRKGKEVIHTGKTLQYVPNKNVYVYFRYNDDDRVMIILNNANEERIVETNRFDEGLNGATQGFDIVSEKNVDLNSKFSIPAKTAMIIDLE